MSTHTYVQNDDQFVACLERMRARGVQAIAMDLEGEFNLHVYGERFCLLQLFDGEEEVVVDPFTTSVQAIGKLLENPAIEKITYDSASDRLLLAKAHGIAMRSIVDLKPAVEILGLEKQDLKSVLAEMLGMRDVGSKKKFQQYNWTRRPVDPEALAYAARDVRHLFDLRDALFAKLEAAGGMDEYLEENRRREEKEPDVDREPGLFRSNRFGRLRRDEKQEFRRLFEIRDRFARELDLPPNSVVANNDLFALATGQITPADLRGNRRLPDRALRAIRSEMEAHRSGSDTTSSSF